jgi:hypothetical protein
MARTMEDAIRLRDQVETLEKWILEIGCKMNAGISLDEEALARLRRQYDLILAAAEAKIVAAEKVLDACVKEAGS